MMVKTVEQYNFVANITPAATDIPRYMKRSVRQCNRPCCRNKPPTEEPVLQTGFLRRRSSASSISSLPTTKRYPARVRTRRTVKLPPIQNSRTENKTEKRDKNSIIEIVVSAHQDVTPTEDVNQNSQSKMDNNESLLPETNFIHADLPSCETTISKGELIVEKYSRNATPSERNKHMKSNELNFPNTPVNTVDKQLNNTLKNHLNNHHGSNETQQKELDYNPYVAATCKGVNGSTRHYSRLKSARVMSPSERQKFRSIFKRLDRDDDGHLRWSDLMDGIRNELGVSFKSFDWEFLKALYLTSGEETYFGLNEFITVWKFLLASSKSLPVISTISRNSSRNSHLVVSSKLVKLITVSLDVFRSVDVEGRGSLWQNDYDIYWTLLEVGLDNKFIASKLKLKLNRKESFTKVDVLIALKSIHTYLAQNEE